MTERPVNLKKLRPGDAERLIRKRAAKTENIIDTTHSDDRSDERDILKPDILRILREGYVDEAPLVNERGDWEAKVCKNINGGRTAVVVTIILTDNDSLVIKTVYWKDV